LYLPERYAEGAGPETDFFAEDDPVALKVTLFPPAPGMRDEIT
jgi:hypothetical protein